MSTVHINAKKEDIAKIVIMPGDPLRAKFIAETYLNNYTLVSSTRNIFAYTGYYKIKELQSWQVVWVMQALEYIHTNYLMSMM